MKKFLAIMMALTMAFGVAACSAPEEEKTDVPAVETAKTFTVGFDAAFPPYGYLDEATGEYVGFDLSLAQEVCARKGWELKKQPIDWDAKDMELSSGTIDCIWNGFTINGREDKYTWSDPYVDNTQVYVVAEDAGIATVADLAGKVVLVQTDSSALHALEGMPEVTDTFGELTQVAEYNTAFMSLEAGAADAVAMDIAVAKYQIESRGGGYVILDEYISSEQYGVGFLLGNDALKDEVQAVLYEMVEDGTFAAIAEEWGVSDLVCLGK